MKIVFETRLKFEWMQKKFLASIQEAQDIRANVSN